MKKVITLAVSFILIMSVLCACGNEKLSKSDGSDDSNGVKNNNYADSEAGRSDQANAQEPLQSETIPSRKLIKNISLEIETKSYDKYIEELRDNVASIEGYIETSNEDNYSELKTFRATIRVPFGKTEGFTETVSKNATVKSRSESTNDVTEAYVDTEARIKVFKAEEESLLEILKKASSVNDLISVRERLTDVRAQIESYTAQLKSLENQTDYSTITITVTEVEREVEKEGYWSKVGNNILKGFSNIVTLITSSFAFILSAIPYLIIIAVIAVVAVIIILKAKKKKHVDNKSDESKKD